MKKEFLNFTGNSWGEYSNASGRAKRSAMCIDPTAINYGEQGECLYAEIDNEYSGVCEDPNAENYGQQGGCVYGLNNEYDPEGTIYGVATNLCQDYLSAFEFLQNNSLNGETVETYYDSIIILLGGWNEPIEVGAYEGNGDESVDNQEAYAASEMMEEDCNTFMDSQCQGSAAGGGSLYSREEVANTLAQAILNINDFVYGVIDGSIVLEGYTPSEIDPLEVLEGLSDIVEIVLRREMECNTPNNIPMVVEQAVGQMAEELITTYFNNGLIQVDLTLEELICMGEYTYADSFAYIWEILNYTPALCGGGGVDCPDCPDCPTVVGGGITSLPNDLGGKHPKLPQHPKPPRPPRKPRVPKKESSAAIRRRR